MNTNQNRPTHFFFRSPFASSSGLGVVLILLGALALTGCDDGNPLSEAAAESADPTATAKVSAQPFAVSGSAVHYFSTAIVHSQEPTGHGMIQRSTDIIELTGDLNGYILYHPTSVFDYEENTLVNTGTQLFSGSVAGSPPMILHDDAFQFEVNLETGATKGVVHLGRSTDAPHHGTWYECAINVVGTGVTPEGDNLSDYSGECIQRGNAS